MSTSRHRQKFPKAARLRRRLDFAAVYESGLRASDQFLLVTALPNDRPLTRLGLSVSKRFGNAVQRNRLKRQLREVFRRCQSELPTGLDLVVQPQSNRSVSQQALRESLIALAHRVAKKLSARPRSTESSVSSARLS